MISIIIPIFNTAAYLARCIASVKSQTYTDWQLILVDDGSTDDSLLLAHQAQAADKRIVVLRQQHSGQSAARNLGLRYAKGEFLAFVDSDDYLDPDYLQTLVSNIGNFDVVQCGYRRVTPDGQVIKTDIPRQAYRLTSMCCRIIRRSLLQKHNLWFEPHNIYEDVLMSVDLWTSSPKIKLIHYAGYNYLVNPHSTTSVTHDTRPVFSQLRKRQDETRGCRNKAIVLYTRLRLWAHFFLGRK